MLYKFFLQIHMIGICLFREGSDGSHTQWQHPQLSQLYCTLVNKFQYSSFPSPAYLVALRLRCVQTVIQCKNFHMYQGTQWFRSLSFYSLSLSLSSSLLPSLPFSLLLSSFSFFLIFSLSLSLSLHPCLSPFLSLSHFQSTFCLLILQRKLFMNLVVTQVQRKLYHFLK